jgi:hypothetical protein
MNCSTSFAPISGDRADLSSISYIGANTPRTIQPNAIKPMLIALYHLDVCGFKSYVR